MSSLKVIRAGQQLLTKIAPKAPYQIKNATDFLFNPVREPQRAYMWEVSFQSHDGSGADLKYYAKMTGVPATIIEPIKRYYQGVEYSYAGRDTSPRIFRATFWDNQRLDVYKFFSHWANTAANAENGTRVLPEFYQRDITLKLLDVTDTVITQEFVMYNCFPTEISEVTLAYSDSTEVTFDVMFSFTNKKLKTAGMF